MDIKEGLTAIVGPDYVIDESKALEFCSRDYSFRTPRVPNFIVKPKSAGEVQDIIKLANEHKTPVVPSSSGIHFNGAVIPVESGIILDLSRMNKILEVDERNRKVKIEPGVTWGELQSELAKYELMALIPLLPHPKRSSLTGHLEREPILITKFEYGDPLLTMEVVFPNGDLLRTGSACTTGSLSDPVADEVQPEGPGLDWFRLFQGAQGTMGVVTWANVKVEYLPKISKTFFIPFQRIEDSIEPLYRIQRRMIGSECFLLNNLNLASILTENWPHDFMVLKEALSSWTLILVLAGGRRHPEQKIEYEEEALREIGSELSIPHIGESIAGVPGVERALPGLLRGPWPEERTYWKFGYKGSCQDLFFLTTQNKAPLLVRAINEVAGKYGYSTGDLGFYLQPIESGRACHCECNIYYDPDNPIEVDRAKKLYMEGAEVLLNMGAFFTRPYGVLAELVYDRTTHYTMALKKVKGLLDPNNIMSPGKLCF
ncbi:MAG: FAD-binding oxidoreductase [Thermodesulfobacteriota bacterium]|nr:FAD-binding oxidoreductase [Thermodesulfobacteriota bacterium]